MPSVSGIRNSTAPERTAFDERVAALKRLKKVAGGSATAVPPDSRPSPGPNPGRGSRGHGTTPSSWSRAPHQAAPGRPYNRFPTCWSKGHRPAESTVDRHLTPQGTQTTGPRTPNPRTHRQTAERAQNQRRGGGGPPCPLRCPFIRKAPPQWAENALGPQTAVQDMAWVDVL